MGDICRDEGKSYFDEYKNNGDIIVDDEIQIKQNREKFCVSVPNTLAKIEEIASKCRDPFPHNYEEYAKVQLFEKYYCKLIDTKTGKHCDEILDKIGEGLLGQPVVNHDIFWDRYRLWNPSLCESNCVVDVHSAIIEYLIFLKEKFEEPSHSNLPLINNDKLYTNYTDNPVNCCGTDDGSIGADTKCKADVSFLKTPLPEEFIGTYQPELNTSGKLENVDSGATTLSAQITLLSLILFIIFALFK